MLKKYDKQQPLISVVMPVYNTEKYVEEATLSVLRQTYPHFELLIADDCSTDKTREILRTLAKADKRIKLIFHKKNLGIGQTMSELVNIAMGKYVARMDSDDIMLPTRLEEQISYLVANPKIGIVGSYLAEIDGERMLTAVRKVPTTHDEIVSGLMTRQTIQNPTLMFNKKLIPQKELYFDSTLSPVDDLDFYLRAAKAGVRFANIPSYLMYYRAHGANSSLSDIKRSYALSSRVRSKFVGDFQVSIRDKFISLLQGIVVKLLPKDWLYPLYKVWQGSGVKGNRIAKIKQNRKFGVSIVMPIYQGEHLAKESVERVIMTMRKMGREFELIVVVDGEVDETKTVLTKLKRQYPELRILTYAKNKGKGYAVRYGMKLASKAYVGYIDAGHDIDTRSLVEMLTSINDDSDIDVWMADKILPMSQVINVPWYRKIYSYVFRHMVSLLFGSRMGDTQVGLKFFRGSVIKKLLSKNDLVINRFVFDVELLSRLIPSARIAHVPVTIRRNGEKSSVGICDIWQMAWDVVRVRFAL